MPENIGDFKELIENSSGIFVDKTMLIQKIIESKTDPLLINRPRRWGKTINMSMMFYFFVHRDQLKGMNKSEEFIDKCNALFTELDILKNNPQHHLAKAYIRQYPVIFVSFTLSGDDSSKDDIDKPDWEKIKLLIINKIVNLFSEFDYLAENLKKIKDQRFNEELRAHIAIYKAQFATETIPPSVTEEIYKNVTQNQLTYPEQKDLEKFNRFRNKESVNDAELSESINFLAKLLSKFHGKPVYIMVDEYDSLVNQYFNHQNILAKLTKIFSGIFSSFAKPSSAMNDYIQKVIFTGILRVAKANIFSGLNNLRECTVLDEAFNTYYGFTQAELELLLMKAELTDSRQDVMRWYNGYKIAGATVYNPWSVMQFITTKKLLPHWIDTANSEIIKDIILNNKGHVINKLLRDIIKNGANNLAVKVSVKKSISVEDLKNPTNIWSFLIHTGYLTFDKLRFEEEFGTFTCYVRIPNIEVATIYNSIVNEWLRQHAHEDSSNQLQTELEISAKHKSKQRCKMG